MFDAKPRKIVWIASYPKSGNTWIRAFILNLFKQLDGSDDGPFDINKMDQATLYDVPAFRFTKLLNVQNLSQYPHEVARARPAVQRSFGATSEHPVFVKTHNCITRENGFNTVDLDVTLSAVYVVRNPLDVALSYSRYTGHALDVMISMMCQPDLSSATTDSSAHEVIGSWSQNVSSWIAVHHRPVHVMRYEDMLAAPTDTFRRLAAFLRVSPSPEQFSRALEYSSFQSLKAHEEIHGFKENPPTAERFFREGKAGQWRDALTREQVMSIVRVHGPMMQRFGYLPPDCGGDVAASLGSVLRPPPSGQQISGPLESAHRGERAVRARASSRGAGPYD
jgi:Sulfotransferase domain